MLTCGNCHTPKGPPAAIAGKDFSGGLSWDEPPFKVTAPNITQDKETGIGNWTDAAVKTVLRKGIRPNGVPVAMIMPSGFYEIMTERDLDAVVAYLRTLKPVKNKVPDPIYKMQQGASGSARRREAVHRSHDERQGEEGLLSRHHRAIAWNAIRRWGRAAANSPTSSAPAASNSPGRGACRCRATSPRARPRASAPGPTTRSSARSRRASSKDGSKLKPPMGFHYYATMTAGRPRRRRGLSAHGAGEGIALLPTPPNRAERGAAGLHLARQGAYISATRRELETYAPEALF